LQRVSVSDAMKATKLGPNTVCNFYGHFRNLVSADIPENTMKIGGPNVIVEIDESKFGKRKFNRGHHVEGVWVVGGIERTPEKKVFLTRVDSRNEKTLIEVIKKHVLPGSIIITDMWRGYFNLSTFTGYQNHLCVNHSMSFKDEITGAHTNTIEGIWNGIKLNLKARNRTKEHINEHLFEYIWRKNNKDNLWGGFIDAIKNIHYE
jgi:transposase-like protein